MTGDSQTNEEAKDANNDESRMKHSFCRAVAALKSQRFAVAVNSSKLVPLATKFLADAFKLSKF